MRWLIITISSFFIGSNMLLALTMFKDFNSYEQSSIVDKNEKIITVTIEIKDHLPIREELNISDKYYVKLFKPKITIINLINNLNISNKYFDILALDLDQTINDDYKLVLQPRSNSIKYYSRYTIILTPLLNLGLNTEDAKKILVLFNDERLNSQQLLENLEEILPTVKRKYVQLMHRFISF